MKRFFVIRASVLAVSCFMSCGNKAEQEAQALADSLATVDSLNAVSAAENAAWQKDSAEIVNKKTYDLTFCEVHGPVQSITQDGTTYEFDEDGSLIKFNGYDPFTADPYSDFENPKTKYVRDKQGRIATMQGWESEVTYKWKDDVLVGDEWGAEAYIGSTTNTYDENGRLIKSVAKESMYDGSDATSTTSNYTYLDIDEYGNWTKRKSGSMVETRTISYYPAERP